MTIHLATDAHPISCEKHRTRNQLHRLPSHVSFISHFAYGSQYLPGQKYYRNHSTTFWVLCFECTDLYLNIPQTSQVSFRMYLRTKVPFHFNSRIYFRRMCRTLSLLQIPFYYLRYNQYLSSLLGTLYFISLKMQSETATIFNFYCISIALIIFL